MIARTVAGGRQSAVRVTPPIGFPPGTSWVKRTTAADRRGGAKQYGTPDPGDAESRVDVHPGTLKVGLEILTLPAAAYEIHIRGRIPPDQLEEFEDLRCVTVEPAQTVLRGRIPDQAALLVGLAAGLGPRSWSTAGSATWTRNPRWGGSARRRPCP